MRNFYYKKNVLVTGGASFIGSHLVEELIKQGAYVRVADDLSSGKIENLSTVIDKIDFCKGCLRDKTFSLSVMNDIQIVFHLAANHGGRGYIDSHPVECLKNMILDGIVFETAHLCGVDKICFASSACVYPRKLQETNSENVIHLKEEWADPKKCIGEPDGEYGWSKLMSELALKAYYDQHNIKTVSCRLFTAYGERENETHAVIALIAKAFVQKDPFPIWGNGQQARNFTYVSDIVEGMLYACMFVSDGSAINIGTDTVITIDECAQKIFRLMNWYPKEIIYENARPTGVTVRSADLTKTKKMLKWSPKTSFINGLKKTVKWYSETRNLEFVKENLDSLLTERSS